MARVLLSHSRDWVLFWVGWRTLQRFQQGIQFSFSRVTLAAVAAQRRAVQRQGGHGLTGHCSGPSRGGSVWGPWVPMGSALPSDQEPSHRPTPPHAVLWAQDALSPRPKPVLGHPPKELQKVSSRLHKENQCGLCRCLACVLVWRSNEVFI